MDLAPNWAGPPLSARLDSWFNLFSFAHTSMPHSLFAIVNDIILQRVGPRPLSIGILSYEAEWLITACGSQKSFRACTYSLIVPLHIFPFSFLHPHSFIDV